MQTILPEELKKRLDAGDKPILLDVREPWEFSICKIEGSVNISMSETEKLINELNANDEIVAICHHGVRSFQVCNYLEDNGFTKVLNLDGGIDSWAKTIDTDMAQY
jgi:rhodanese-related sulfurtransferase|tara:strand:+ start:121 stop:438 length:318 start_codon:yes stop_codon:yes gene_type:complete